MYSENTLNDLNQFKVGDKVTIYNSITKTASRQGIIKSIYPTAYMKNGKPSRIATIVNDMGVTIGVNYLSTAKKC